MTDDAVPRRCHRCAAEPEPADAAASLLWVLDRDGHGPRWLCPDCARVHARDIEARLPDRWW